MFTEEKSQNLESLQINILILYMIKNIIQNMKDPQINFLLSTERGKNKSDQKIKQMLKLTDKDFKTVLTIICNELKENIFNQ